MTEPAIIEQSETATARTGQGHAAFQKRIDRLVRERGEAQREAEGLRCKVAAQQQEITRMTTALKGSLAAIVQLKQALARRTMPCRTR